LIPLRSWIYVADDLQQKLMAQKIASITRAGPALDAAAAEKIFGWKNVHKYRGVLVGKKQDRAGRWRRTKVPRFSTDPAQAYLIDQKMEQLGRAARYRKELSKLSGAKRLPVEWATPEQRAVAALKTLGK
jgi:hypothetical protein